MELYRPLLLLFFAGILSGQSPGKSDSVAIRNEAKCRHESLIKEGYNLTYGWSLGGHGEKKTILLPLLVPEAKTEHQFSFWCETQEGEASVRLLNEDGKTLVTWSGRKGEMVISRRVPTGKYVLEIDSSKSMGGYAEFGVKGPLAQRCDLDQSRCHEFPAAPSKGFHWPYLLFVPKTVKCPTILVAPNNTGFAVENIDLIQANASCEIQRMSVLANRLGCPLLVPLFPRPVSTIEEGNLYLHALSRASLVTQVESWKRVDLQLLGMIHDAQIGLQAMGLKVASKVILSGFSASGSFVNRFTVLHPEHVLAVACGSPGGWPMVPISELEGDRLGYPLGLADLQDLTGDSLKNDSLKQVRWFFFLGDQDTNDAVPYRDSFTKLDEDLINRRFGKTLVARWKQAELLYSSSGMRARFKLYPGVPHVVAPETQEDIARFFEECLAGTFEAPLDSMKRD